MNSQPNDVIVIDSVTTWHSAELCGASEILLDKSLTIRGDMHKPPILSCPQTDEKPVFNITGPVSSNQTVDNMVEVTFLHILITNARILLNNANLTLRYCTLEDTEIISDNQNDITNYAGLFFYDTLIFGHIDESCSIHYAANCSTSSFINILSQTLSLHYQNVKFLQHRQTLQTTSGNAMVVVQNCTFTNNVNKTSILGGMYITIPTLVSSLAQSNSTLVFQDTTFENQINHNPVDSITNIFVSALTVRSKAIGRQNISSNVNVNIENCLFQNNERGLTLIGNFKSAHVSNCTFKENHAIHAGAGILVLMDVKANLKIEKSLFVNNVAGAWIEDQVGHHDNVRLEDQVVHVNSSCCNGVIKVGYF